MGTVKEEAWEEKMDALRAEFGDADFIEFLGELAPYLKSPLTIQAVQYYTFEFPIYAAEWHVEPGNSKVEVKRFRYEVSGSVTSNE
jgi:hypothetical protein